jgi:2-amino-4-hydroxy-6-hydroxymethyldihydropteridine diphosphokinase
MKKNNKIALAFGGNIGETSRYFEKAIKELTANELVVENVSPVFSTPAVNCEDNANDFCNCIITGFWQKSPIKLLKLCQKIELLIGRPKKHSSNESRLIDIDIILFAEQVINNKELIIPHPRAHERLFVLIPLNEVASTWEFPNLNFKTEEILNNLKKEQSELFNIIYSSREKISKSVIFQ